MKETLFLEGFSKKSKNEKLEIISSFLKDSYKALDELKSFHHQDEQIQDLIDNFSENTISNFHLPYSIAPNFKINNRTYAVPMVIEESSVVAAASKSAKFWYNKGGFKAEVVGMDKIGQVHFTWEGDKAPLVENFEELKNLLITETDSITKNMRNRGGGIKNIELRDLTDKEEGLMQLHATFETVDSMGANFVNSCLEEFAEIFKTWVATKPEFKNNSLDIIMCILSNYTPNCLVKCWVECELSDFDNLVEGISGEEFANKFQKAVKIAEIDPYRATTHNKGIYNGVDAVVLATGNDFRAVEACGHAYAYKDGQYTSLTHVDIIDDKFIFTLKIPMALGVVGGLTNLHPVVKRSLQLLGNPDAKELMMISAAAGLANNFGAVKSLTTTGIQQGHMKMHLYNILNQFDASESEKEIAVEYFKENKVSVSGVREFLENIRQTEDESTLNI